MSPQSSEAHMNCVGGCRESHRGCFVSSLLHYKKPCQPFIAACPLQPIPRICIIISFLLSTGGFWLSIIPKPLPKTLPLTTKLIYFCIFSPWIAMPKSQHKIVTEKKYTRQRIQCHLLFQAIQYYILLKT